MFGSLSKVSKKMSDQKICSMLKLQKKKSMLALNPLSYRWLDCNINSIMLLVYVDISLGSRSNIRLVLCIGSGNRVDQDGFCVSCVWLIIATASILQASGREAVSELADIEGLGREHWVCWRGLFVASLCIKILGGRSQWKLREQRKITSLQDKDTEQYRHIKGFSVQSVVIAGETSTFHPFYFRIGGRLCLHIFQ